MRTHVLVSLMLLCAPAHGAEDKLRDNDKKTSAALLNVIRHPVPAWAQESRNKLILLLRETCSLPTVLGNIILEMMGDMGYGKWFPHVTINNNHKDGEAMHIAPLSHGRFAVTACPENNIVRVFGSDGTVRHTLQHCSEVIHLTAFSNGECVAASSVDGTVNAWDITYGKEVRLLCTFSQLLSADQIHENRFLELPPHRLVLGNYGTLQLWDTQNKKRLLTSTHNRYIVTPLVQLSTGNIAVGYYKTSENYHEDHYCGLALWNTTTGAFSYIPRAHPNDITAITAVRNGLLVTASYDQLGKEGIIKVWDTQKVSLLHTLQPHHSTAHSLVALSDGTFASRALNCIEIFNPVTGMRMHTLHDTNIQFVRSLLELPYGRLAAGSSGKIVTLWDIKTGTCLQKLTGHKHDIVILKKLSNGKLLSADYMGNIVIFNSAIDPATFSSQKSQTQCSIS